MLELHIMLNFAFQHQINIVLGIVVADKKSFSKFAYDEESLELDIFKRASATKEIKHFNVSETENALKVTIEQFYRNCLSDNFIGYINDNKALFIIIANDTSKLVTRIYSAINKKLLKQKLPSISIDYTDVSSQTKGTELMERLNATLSNKSLSKVDLLKMH